MYGWLALEMTSKGATTILLFIFKLTIMEKTLISTKRFSLKFIKNTLLFGISYDKPDLFIAFLCFVIELDFSTTRKRKSVKR